MSRLQTPIRRNDNVVVTTGKDSGKKGRVLKVIPGKGRVVVDALLEFFHANEAVFTGAAPGCGDRG